MKLKSNLNNEQQDILDNFLNYIKSCLVCQLPDGLVNDDHILDALYLHAVNKHKENPKFQKNFEIVISCFEPCGEVPLQDAVVQDLLQILQDDFVLVS
jgi:hypothetical protein